MSTTPVHWHLETSWDEVPVNEFDKDLFVQRVVIGAPSEPSHGLGN